MAQIGETELDIHALWLALWRRAWLLAILVVIAGAGTYIGLGFVTPLYTADTSILMEDRESPLTRPRDQTSDNTPELDQSAIQSQVEVLRSRDIANAVIDNLKLTGNPAFDPARHPSLLSSVMIALGIEENPTDATIRQRVMDTYFSRLSVFPLQQSRVVGVEFTAPDPELAAQVANAVADAFVALQQQAKRESAVAATDWLQEEIQRLRGKVADAEQAVAAYQTKQGLYDVQSDGSGQVNTLSTQQLSDINAELARARAAQAEATARAQSLQQLLDEGGSLDASAEVLNSPLIQRLRERQVALQAQIADLSTTLLPGHPRIRALKSQLDNLDAQIRSEAQKILESLNTGARIAGARVASLEKSLNDAKADVSQSNEKSIELRALQREATAQRDLLESFLSRYREAAARTDTNYLPADARIISRAVAPAEPSYPKKPMLAIAAALAVLLIAIAILFMREFTSGRAFRVVGYGVLEPASEPLKLASRVRPDEPPPGPDGGTHETLPEEASADSAEGDAALASPEVESAASAESAEEKPADDEPEPETKTAAAAKPVAAEPEAAPDAGKIETAAGADSAKPDTATGAASAHTREEEEAGSAELAAMIGRREIRVALFAGLNGGEGAGAIAFSAARLAGKERLRCIVIDLGRMPSEALSHDGPGVADLMTGAATFGEVIQRDETARVHVIPYGTSGNEPPAQRLPLVLGALSHTYDKVIVVVDRFADWPHEHLHPDLAAIVCEPDASDESRADVYEAALERGAKTAVIVRYTSDMNGGSRRESAAA
jgi:exopolysaccharide transport family protein